MLLGDNVIVFYGDFEVTIRGKGGEKNVEGKIGWEAVGG